MSGTREWDAGTYDRVSAPQLAWGRELLARLDLEGGERVLDAGCGSGRVSELLLAELPRGELVGVDGSRAMIERAGKLLGERAELTHSDLLELRLGKPVDAVFSSATFHWILDHDRLFAQVASWLRAGGRLEAQCGGEGNLDAFFAVVTDVERRAPFAKHLAGRPSARNFAAAEATAERLRRAGFEAVRCWLEPRPERPPEPRAYIEAVCLGAHTALLPEPLARPVRRCRLRRLDGGRRRAARLRAPQHLSAAGAGGLSHRRRASH